MNLLDNIVEGSSIIFEGNKYNVLGKCYYVTQKDPKTVYAKILMNDHHVLVVSPTDNVAYFGKNFGQIREFDSFDTTVKFKEKYFEQVNTDYQIMIELVFGAPLDVEGEVLYWDYESGDDIISVAIVSRTNKRADVVAKYIDLFDVQIV